MWKAARWMTRGAGYSSLLGEPPDSVSPGDNPLWTPWHVGFLATYPL